MADRDDPRASYPAHRPRPYPSTERPQPAHQRPIPSRERPAPSHQRPRPTQERLHPADDVETARRAVATFGYDDEPGPGDAVRAFTRRYGWRAYALPILLVVSVLALVTAKEPDRPRTSASRTTPSHTPSVSVPPTAGGSISLKNDAPTGSVNAQAINAMALPPGAKYTVAGKGTYSILKGTTKVFGHSSTGKVWRYDIEVENGITGVDLVQFENLVDTTLADPRSWSGHGVAFERVDSGSVDFHISLTTSMTVRKWCGYTDPIETSCYATADSVSGLYVNRVVLNDARWVRGDAAYIGDLTAYREEMINHEDGHAIGHMHAHQCLSDGLAPAMMQQTIGLLTPSGQICQANPWPYPPGATDAPGVEAADTPANNEYNLQVNSQ